VTPLLLFNPSVIVSLAENQINVLSDLRNKVLGLNKQSSVYQQILYLIKKGKLEKDIKEYPIGYGGTAQLLSGEVDAIMAYTTNVTVNLEIERGKENIKEIHFDKYEIYTYGIVLVFGSETQLSKAGLTKEDVQKFIEVTKDGYRKGAEDITGSVNALKQTEPTLEDVKIAEAIKKIKRLNNEGGYPLDQLDIWVENEKITPSVRNIVILLYK